MPFVCGSFSPVSVCISLVITSMDSPSPLNLRDDLDGYLKKGSSANGTAVFQDRLQQGFKWLKIKGSRNETLEEIDQSAEKDPWFPSMTRQQRFLGFLGFFAAGICCFVIASFYLPVLILKSRKFAILFTFGSLFLITSFGVLRGPYNHFHGMLQADRLPQTTLYFFSMVATLFFALQLQSTLLTVLAAVVQIFTLIWYSFSYLPGGHTGFRFFSKLATSVVKKTATNTFSA